MKPRKNVGSTMFKTKELSLFTLLVLLNFQWVNATVKKRVKWSPKPAEKPLEKSAEYLPEQQLQLKKAQQAHTNIENREQKVLKTQQRPNWEKQQMQRSQQQFSERIKREAKPLKQAQKAAAKSKK